MKPLIDVRILKIELVDIAREFACGDNALVYIAQLEAENEALREAGKGMLTLADSHRENAIIFPYADEIVAMRDALLTGEKATPEDTPISDIPASP